MATFFDSEEHMKKVFSKLEKELGLRKDNVGIKPSFIFVL